MLLLLLWAFLHFDDLGASFESGDSFSIHSRRVEIQVWGSLIRTIMLCVLLEFWHVLSGVLGCFDDDLETWRGSAEVAFVEHLELRSGRLKKQSHGDRRGDCGARR